MTKWQRQHAAVREMCLGRAMTVAIKLLLRCRLWEVQARMRLPDLAPRPGFGEAITGWLYRLALRRQRVDDLHHAPVCRANHYHRRRLVTGPCSCGARAEATK